MKPKGIVIHCSDSPQDRGDDASTIHNWHKKRGWDGIGYHKVILEDGTIQNGRPLYWSGAHARGYNDYIGYCLIGIDTFTDKQMTSLILDIADMMLEYSIPKEKILGHYEVSSKTCPNFDVQKEVRDRL